jgi:hypothetical protein
LIANNSRRYLFLLLLGKESAAATVFVMFDVIRAKKNYFYFSGFDVCLMLSVCLFVCFRCQVCLFVCLSFFDVNLWLVSISRVNRSGTCKSVRICLKTIEVLSL